MMRQLRQAWPFSRHPADYAGLAVLVLLMVLALVTR